MLMTERLYLEVEKIWDGYLQQPFLREIKEGRLPLEKFRYYMIQDYLYLLEYVKVFAMGVVKARDEGIMRHYAQLVGSTMDGEMKIHRAYMKRLGITSEEVQSAKPQETNCSYTSYMQKIAYEGSLLELTIAVLSCSWSYERIGKALASQPGALENEIYGEWIAGYSGEEFAKGNQILLDLTNQLGKDCSDQQYDVLKDIFVRCSVYEREFWNMAYAGEDEI